MVDQDKVLYNYVCHDYWPPAPAPQLGESWPFEQVHMLGLEQKPSPHEFLQIAGEERRGEGIGLLIL